MDGYVRTFRSATQCAVRRSSVWWLVRYASESYYVTYGLLAHCIGRRPETITNSSFGLFADSGTLAFAGAASSCCRT